MPAIAPASAYRQLHDETNVAAVTLVALSLLANRPFNAARRGQELVLHGLLQRGRYQPGSGVLLRNALDHLGRNGVRASLLCDAHRVASLQQLRAAAGAGPEATLESDLRATPTRPFKPDEDLTRAAPVLLVESRRRAAELSLHVLLLRRSAAGMLVMNSAAGLDLACTADDLAAHLASPVAFGPGSFAGGQYLYTGLAVRLSR